MDNDDITQNNNAVIPTPIRRNLTQNNNAVIPTSIRRNETQPNIVFTHQQSSIEGNANEYVAENVGFRGGWNEFMEASRSSIVSQLEESRGSKVIVSISVKMSRSDDQFTAYATKNLRIANPITVTNSADLNAIYDEIMEELNEQIESLEDEGSGWSFEEVDKVVIRTVVYDPLRASKYLELPKHIADKKAVINIQNNDEECFKWCLALYLRKLEEPKLKNGHRVDKKLKEAAKKLNMEGIRSPTPIKDIKKFEELNKDFAIVVLGINELGNICLLDSSKHCYKRKHLVILLMIGNEKMDYHYTLVIDDSKLLSKQHSLCKVKIYRCWNCLNVFRDEKKYNYHIEQCKTGKSLIIKMPEEGSVIKFKKFNNVRRLPFVIYCDIECITSKIEYCDVNPEISHTTKIQKHNPISYVLHLVSFNQNVLENNTIIYTGEDCMEDLVINLEYICSKVYNLIPGKEKITRENKQNYLNSNKCYICDGYFNEENKKKKDFCYYTGNYLGACHFGCLNKRVNFIPVFFHNLSNYDSHLFITNLASKINGENLNCIANNEQKYISFSKNNVVDYYEDSKTKVKKPIKFRLTFVDSFKFMGSSLASLGNNLSNNKFKSLEKRFFGEQLEMAKRKGVFPYDWFDCIEKLNYTSLPPWEDFYSILNDGGISRDEYDFALKAWDVFKCKTFQDYLEIYNEIDTLLLADIFENFRDVCLENYEIDPAYYITSPSLFWDAMLKQTKVELELLSDIDMYYFFKRMIRGGISMVSTRYAKANNPYMEDLFNSEEETSYIIYLDKNNLYGYIMVDKLPYSDFKWLTNEELDYLFNNQSKEEWEKTPCVLEVDLEYPKELHDFHNDLPCCPETIEFKNKIKKLIPNLNNKEKYVIHYQTLIFVLSLGLKLNKIHSGIKFKEEAWMNPYIEKNTYLRTKATNDFDKDFFKLANNANFGKCLEDETKRCNVQLVTLPNRLKKLSSKTNFKNIKIFNENLVSVHMGMTEVKIKKPIYAGATILDKSKIPMLDFFYNYLKKKYNDKIKLLCTDTDSFICSIKTEDVYKDIDKNLEEYFDTSNYPTNHPSGIRIGINKKIPGKMKDEKGGEIIVEFVALCAKQYAIKMLKGDEEKKCKGIKNNVIKNKISFEDYKECLFTKTVKNVNQHNIRSYDHKVYTEKIRKVALTGKDDKRYILGDGVNTLALGHYKLKE